MELKQYSSLGEMIRDNDVVWYGPHKCDGCYAIIVKSSESSGGISLDAPHNLSLIQNHNWQLHRQQTLMTVR